MRHSAIIGAVLSAASSAAAIGRTTAAMGMDVMRHLNPRGGLANSGYYRSNWSSGRVRHSRNDDPSYRKSIWPEGKIAKPGRMG